MSTLINWKKTKIIKGFRNWFPDHQATGTSYIPLHKLKVYFLDTKKISWRITKQVATGTWKIALLLLRSFYRLYLGFLNYRRPVWTIPFISSYKLQRGNTCRLLFYHFKVVVKAATKKGYFKINPADGIKSKARKNFKIKEILTPEDYIKLMKIPCLNHEVKSFCRFFIRRSALDWYQNNSIGKWCLKNQFVFTRTNQKYM